MQATSQLTENIITLKGSTELVTEFFSYSINRCTSACNLLCTSYASIAVHCTNASCACTHSILYQRGIYPPESFKQVQKYGLNMLVTADEKLDEFFQKFLQQLSSKCVCA